MNHCDIAIYGLGPASIFFLKKFINTNIKINIYEFANEDSISKLDTIDHITGPIEFFKNNNKERASGFFGTASLWDQKGVGGKFFKFDKEDFEKWHWPITLAEIDENYEAIIKYLKNNFAINLEGDFNELDLKSIMNFKTKSLALQKKGSQTLSYNFNKVIKGFKSKIKNSKNINIFYQSELINFEIKKDANLVDYSNVVISGDIKKVNANFHILSTGCLESNKILLNTFKDTPSYIENKHIGKNLAFHISSNIGRFYSAGSKIKKKKLTKKFNFTNEILGLKIINFEEDEANSAILYSFEQSSSKNILKRCYNKFYGDIDAINTSFVFEHFPSVSNYIELSNKKNKEGGVMFNIFTDFTDKNLNFAKKKYKAYVSLLEQSDICDYQFSKKDFSVNLETNNHHHGGLIFGDKNSAPVDRNLQFKDLNNLYINGSSVFPSGSIYNPTFTIIALADRLSNFILKKYYHSA